MDTVLSTHMNAMYVERLQQAVRVMEGLSDTERANFDICVIAVRREIGVSACIAGFCGQDPWFQAQGLITTIEEDEPYATGSVAPGVTEFFGTGAPFYRSHYVDIPADRRVTVDDAIVALNKAIASFDSGSAPTSLLTSQSPAEGTHTASEGLNQLSRGDCDAAVQGY